MFYEIKVVNLERRNFLLVKQKYDFKLPYSLSRDKLITYVDAMT